MKRANYRIVFFFICVFLAQIGTNVLLKLAATSSDVRSFNDLALNVFYVFSLVLLGIRIVFWQLILGVMELSKAFSFRSLSYVLLLIVGALVFDEEISWYNVVGSIVIVFGVYVNYKS